MPGNACSRRAPETIVLVSDELTDGHTVEHALKRVKAPHVVVTASPLQVEALLTTWNTGPTRSTGVPRLVLIDTVVPTGTHVEVMRIIRSIRSMRHAPILMLADRSTDDEVRLCYEAGANSFLCKPDDVEAQVDAICTAVSYWLMLNLPPTLEAP